MHPATVSDWGEMHIPQLFGEQLWKFLAVAVKLTAKISPSNSQQPLTE